MSQLLLEQKTPLLTEAQDWAWEEWEESFVHGTPAAQMPDPASANQSETQQNAKTAFLGRLQEEIEDEIAAKMFQLQERNYLASLH